MMSLKYIRRIDLSAVTISCCTNNAVFVWPVSSEIYDPCEIPDHRIYKAGAAVNLLC